MDNEMIFDTDKNYDNNELLSYNGEIPITKIDFLNDENAVLYGGIGAHVIVTGNSTFTMRGAVPIVSCKIVEVSSGQIIADIAIVPTDFSTGPIRAPYDNTIKKELGPLNLKKGAYRVEIYAKWALLAGIGSYSAVGAGYSLTENGNTFAAETFEPSRGNIIGEARRIINF